MSIYILFYLYLAGAARLERASVDHELVNLGQPTRGF